MNNILFDLHLKMKMLFISNDIENLVEDLTNFNTYISLGIEIDDEIELKKSIKKIKENLIITKNQLNKEFNVE